MNSEIYYKIKQNENTFFKLSNTTKILWLSRESQFLTDIANVSKNSKEYEGYSGVLKSNILSWLS